MDLTHGRTDVFSGPAVTDVVISLGYPVIYLAILGVWKIPGAVILVVPGLFGLRNRRMSGSLLTFRLQRCHTQFVATGKRSSHRWRSWDSG